MHRYSLFASHPAADAIVCANAGWFTMPDESVCYPYGIKNVPLSDRDLARAFARPVIMLMGGMIFPGRSLSGIRRRLTPRA